MTAYIRCTAYALGLAALLCVAGSGDVTAQPKQTAPAVVDTFIAVVPRRPIEEIKKDIEQVTAQRRDAKLRLEKAQEEVRTLDNILGMRKKDIEALEGHLDTLDAEKKAGEIASLKSKIALLEKLRDLLEVRKDVREGEVESATAAVAYTEAQEELYDLEGTLTTKRGERVELAKKPGSAADIAAMDLAIKKLEDEVLDRWKKALKKHENSVSEEQDLLSLLRKLEEAQESFHGQ
jgi:chromosome segregation ATPase